MNRIDVFSVELRTSSDATDLGAQVDRFIKGKAVRQVETVISHGYATSSFSHKPILIITVHWED